MVKLLLDLPSGWGVECGIGWSRRPSGSRVSRLLRNAVVDVGGELWCVGGGWIKHMRVTGDGPGGLNLKSVMERGHEPDQTSQVAIIVQVEKQTPPVRPFFEFTDGTFRSHAGMGECGEEEGALVVGSVSNGRGAESRTNRHKDLICGAVKPIGSVLSESESEGRVGSCDY